MKPLVRLASLTIAVSIWIQLTSACAQVDPDRYSGAQIQRDLDSLATWIMAIHPSPYVHCSSVEFEETLESAKATFAGGGTLYGAAQMAAKVCNVLKDSHTGVALQSFSIQLGSQYGHLPLEIQTVNNRLIVTATIGNSTMIGEEILRVNGVSARSVLGGGLALVSQEGDAAIARLRMSEKLWNDIAPFAIGAGISDSVLVEYASGRSERLPVMDNEDIQNWHASQNKEVPLFWHEQRSDSTVAVVLTIQHFHPENVRSFRQELKACFRHIQALQTDEKGVTFTGLILDLRGNSGGHIAIMAELLPYLTPAPVHLPAGVQIKASEQAKARWGTGRFGLISCKSYLKNLQVLKSTLSRIEGDSIAFIPFDRPIKPVKRLAYSGTAALLLDGLSASATVSIASWFVRSGRGETFGEPPMGSVSGTFGNPVRLQLPETGLVINVASARYFTQTPVRWEARPLLVDHPITPTAQDIKTDKDPVLTGAFDWMNQNQPR
jgi:hypothetical protein